MIKWRNPHNKSRGEKTTSRISAVIYQKDDAISFNTHVAGDFGIYKNAIANKIVEIEDLLKKELGTGGIDRFYKKIPRNQGHPE